jgi:AraC-like DNA-binding protein
MELCDSYARMRRAPVGRAIAGPSFALWCGARDLLGVTMFGRPGLADIARLAEVLDAPHPAALAPRCDCLYDASRVERVDAEVFQEYLATLQARARVLRARVRRQALVRPAGLTGAIVAGVAEVAAPGIDARVFERLDDALAWLGREHALAGDIDALVESLRGGLSGRLRPMLVAGADVAGAARRLGLSTRSLQRQLRDEGTSFRAELEAVRLDRIKTLLTDTDLKLEAIARKVGLAGGPQLTTFFRSRSGETPSAWRSLHRK